jgi:hypothetical protein
MDQMTGIVNTKIQIRMNGSNERFEEGELASEGRDVAMWLFAILIPSY